MSATPQSIDVIEQVQTPNRKIGGTVAVSKDAALPSVSVEVAAGATDEEVLLAIDVSQIGVICISADGDLTLKFNSSSVPAPSLALKANVPYIWHANSYFTNLLTVDVTKVYVSNAGASTVTLNVEGNYDCTP